MRRSFPVSSQRELRPVWRGRISKRFAAYWNVSREICSNTPRIDRGYITGTKSRRTRKSSGVAAALSKSRFIPETVLFGIDSNGQAVKKGTTWKHDKDFRHEGERYHVAPQRRDCKDMILSILQREESNAIASKELKWELELLGFSKTTVERSCNELRAEKKIEFRTVGAAKKGNRQWYTALVGASAIPEPEDRCQQMSCDDVPFA